MIHLRRCRPDDADALHDAVRESIDELAKWMPWCQSGYRREDAAGWLEAREAAWENNQELDFAIKGDDGWLLGCCGLHHIDAVNRTAHLGYWVRASAWNRGVATSAVRELCDFAFEERKLHRLEIIVAEENTASQCVAEKTGATREALLRERLFLHGRYHNAVMFAIFQDL